MNKNMMLQEFEHKLNAYRIHHPSTADMDHFIFQAHCAGKTAVQISTAVPCSESTVYRALRRIRQFLNQLEQISHADVLLKQLMAGEINYGDWNAKNLLEMLYVAFAENGNLRSEHTTQGFADLHRLLDGFSETLPNCVFNTVYDLFLSHERTAFTEGIKVGVRLGSELGI